MRYNLKDIVIFTYVAKLRSFARASEALGISRTVVSTRVSELEKLLGINLLARTTREVNLTSDGKFFFDHCNSILEKVENLDEFLCKHKGIFGNLRLAMPPYFARHYVAGNLNEFLKKYPDLKLNIILTENPVNIISEGYDLQIRVNEPHEEGLQVEKLLTRQNVICASKEYINKHGKPLKPRDLLRHNCLVLGNDSGWKFENKKNHQIIKLDEVSGNVRCSNGEAMKELLLAGIGIAVKSVVDIEKEIIAGDLIVLFDDYKVLNDAEFYAVYPAGKYTSPKTKVFIEFLREKFADNPKHQEIVVETKTSAKKSNMVKNEDSSMVTANNSEKYSNLKLEN